MDHPYSTGTIDRRPPDVVPVHTAVPGRARFRIDGLRGSVSLKRRLERLVPDGGRLQVGRADPLTGTLLIFFSPDLSLTRIVERVEHVVRPTPDTARSALDLPAAGPLTAGGSGVAEPPWHAVTADEVAAA